MTHHNGTAEVFAEGPDQSRFVWTTDLLPDSGAERSILVVALEIHRDRGEASFVEIGDAVRLVVRVAFLLEHPLAVFLLWLKSEVTTYFKSI